MKSHALLLAFLLSCASSSALANQDYRLAVNAGPFDRQSVALSFDVPEIGPDYTLRDATGNSVPLQIDHLGRATFLLGNLKKGETAHYRLTSAANASHRNHGQNNSKTVQANTEKGKVQIFVRDQPVLVYQAEKSELPRPDIRPIFQRGGYIHPILSPSGKLITDDYPSNHIHHHGIWFPWTKTEFEGRTPDFWNMGQGSGTVEFVSLENTWSGPVHGGFSSRHRFVDLTAPAPRVALYETWEVKVYQTPSTDRPYWMFDLISRQECATSSPLVLPKYHYGGLGVRGHWDWNGRENTFWLTSEGETDRIRGNETRGRWCHMGGKVDGELTGIAILDHPDNFRAPQPMRLHPSEPFFCYAPSQLGDWEITPGRPYVSQYRFIVQDGPPDSALIDRLWNDYAHPPEIKLERAPR